MNSLKAELKSIALRLASEKIPYMVIGGLANLEWGEPRSTLDLDITIKIEDATLASFVRNLSEAYDTLMPEPAAFAQKNRVLPLRSKMSGISIDLICSMMPYEEEAIERAVWVDIDGVPVKYCTAEDLIIHKIISDRPKDIQDVASIIRRRRSMLDLAYLAPRVEELSRLLDSPDIQNRFRLMMDGRRPPFA